MDLKTTPSLRILVPNINIKGMSKRVCKYVITHLWKHIKWQLILLKILFRMIRQHFNAIDWGIKYLEKLKEKTEFKLFRASHHSHGSWVAYLQYHCLSLWGITAMNKSDGQWYLDCICRYVFPCIWKGVIMNWFCRVN